MTTSMKTSPSAERSRPRHSAGLAAGILGCGQPLSRPVPRDAGRDRRAARPGIRGAHDDAARMVCANRQGRRSPTLTSPPRSPPRRMRKASTCNAQGDGRGGAEASRPPRRPLPTVARLAAEASGIDWPGIIEDRFGHWAAGYFDQGRRSGPLPKRRQRCLCTRGAQYATHDLTPEIAGLKGFAQCQRRARQCADEAIKRAMTTLACPKPRWAPTSTAHCSAGRLGAGAATSCGRPSLRAARTRRLTDLLTIRLVWEEALFLQYATRSPKAGPR
jgi:hypothetical protein